MTDGHAPGLSEAKSRKAHVLTDAECRKLYAEAVRVKNGRGVVVLVERSGAGIRVRALSPG